MFFDCANLPTVFQVAGVHYCLDCLCKHLVCSILEVGLGLCTDSHPNKRCDDQTPKRLFQKAPDQDGYVKKAVPFSQSLTCSPCATKCCSRSENKRCFKVEAKYDTGFCGHTQAFGTTSFTFHRPCVYQNNRSRIGQHPKVTLLQFL